MARVIAEGVGTVYVRAENGGIDMVPFAEGDEVPNWAAKQMGDHCFDADDEAEDGPLTGDYGDASAKQLKAEIDRRNEGRDDDQKISKSGNKDALIEALTADDDA